MSWLRNIYKTYRNFILYGIIGACTAGLDFFIFTLLTRFTGLHYIIANVISCLTGILCSFFLNRRFNFKVTDHTFRRMLIFLSVGLFGMFLSSVILRLCVETLEWHELLSKVVSIVIVVAVQFLLNKYISFRQINAESKV